MATDSSSRQIIVHYVGLARRAATQAARLLKQMESRPQLTLSDAKELEPISRVIERCMAIELEAKDTAAGVARPPADAAIAQLTDAQLKSLIALAAKVEKKPPRARRP